MLFTVTMLYLANAGADERLYIKHPTIAPEKVTDEEVGSEAIC